MEALDVVGDELGGVDQRARGERLARDQPIVHRAVAEQQALEHAVLDHQLLAGRGDIDPGVAPVVVPQERGAAGAEHDPAAPTDPPSSARRVTRFGVAAVVRRHPDTSGSVVTGSPAGVIAYQGPPLFTSAWPFATRGARSPE